MAQRQLDEPKAKVSRRLSHTFVIDSGDGGVFEIIIPSKFIERFDPREAVAKAFEATAEALLEQAKCFRGR